MSKTVLLRFAVALVLSRAALGQCELQRLTAPNPETLFYGNSVALSDEFAVVGAPLESTVYYHAGAAYVYLSTSSGLVRPATLYATIPPPAGEERFGDSVAIFENTILVGAPGEYVGGAWGAGAVFVFEYDGALWNQTATLTASDSETNMGFGSAVALEGDRALIGAPGGLVGGTGAGAAYVFERSGSVWIETAKLTPSDGAPLDGFGLSVSLSGDLALVGSLTADGGAAYVYDHTVGWAEVAKLVPSDPEPDDSFGGSVAILGNTAVIGDRGDDERGDGAGAAYVFERDGSTWRQSVKLLAPDGVARQRFGGVAIEAEKIVVGAGGPDAFGSAYVFLEHPSGWIHAAKLVPSDGDPNTEFGGSLAIAGDAILAGARLASGPFGKRGAAYLFQMPSFATAYCFGVACPCGNDDPAYGCASSSLGLDGIPQGGLLAACGSASVASDDLVLTASQLPPDQPGIFFMGGSAIELPFGDGKRCVGAGGIGIFRYLPPAFSGPTGMITLGPGIVLRSQGFAAAGRIDAGETWHFQGWFRDPTGPCGTAFNLTNGLAVTFAP